jgi:hypothetical protein
MMVVESQTCKNIQKRTVHEDILKHISEKGIWKLKARVRI